MRGVSRYITFDCLNELETKVHKHYQENFNLEAFLALFDFSKIERVDSSFKNEFQAIADALKNVKDWEAASNFLEELVGDEQYFSENETIEASQAFAFELGFVNDLFCSYQKAKKHIGIDIDREHLEREWNKAILKELIRAILKKIETQLEKQGYQTVANDLKACRKALIYESNVDSSQTVKDIIAPGIDAHAVPEPTKELLTDYLSVFNYWSGRAKIDGSFIILLNRYLQPEEVKDHAVYQLERIYDKICPRRQTSIEPELVFHGSLTQSTTASLAPSL